jgi:hypothetical protein
MKRHLTQSEANELAQTIRNLERTKNSAVSLHTAFCYHFPLFLWRIETAEQFINAMLIAAFNFAPKSIVSIIGLDRSQEISSPLLSLDDNYGPNRFRLNLDTPSTTNTSKETASF